jgi:hypothetical protein
VKRLVALALSMAATSALAADYYPRSEYRAPPPPPPVEGSPPRCVRAVVSGLFDQWGRLPLAAVRAGPSVEFPILDRVANGHLVFVCDRYDSPLGAVWLAVIYDDGCPFDLNAPLRWRENPCMKGWVYRGYLTPLEDG